MKIHFKNVEIDCISVNDSHGKFTIRPFKVCNAISRFKESYVLSVHDQHDEAIFILSGAIFPSRKLAWDAMTQVGVDIFDDFRPIIDRCVKAGVVAC